LKEINQCTVPRKAVNHPNRRVNDELNKKQNKLDIYLEERSDKSLEDKDKSSNSLQYCDTPTLTVNHREANSDHISPLSQSQATRSGSSHNKPNQIPKSPSAMAGGSHNTPNNDKDAHMPPIDEDELGIELNSGDELDDATTETSKARKDTLLNMALKTFS
jgi:hypothetical protein